MSMIDHVTKAVLGHAIQTKRKMMLTQFSCLHLSSSRIRISFYYLFPNKMNAHLRKKGKWTFPQINIFSKKRKVYWSSQGDRLSGLKGRIDHSHSALSLHLYI